MTKEKGKSHPFAGRLDSNEEILWMMTTPPPRVWESFKAWLRLGSAFFALFFVGTLLVTLLKILLAPPMKDLPPLSSEQTTIIMAVILAALIMGICFSIGAVFLNATLRIPYFIWMSRQPFHHAYAVTNKRLLRRSFNDFSCVSLNKIPEVRLSAPTHGGGTLSFGADFRRWRHLEDAPAVQDLIEDARREWLKVIQG